MGIQPDYGIPMPNTLNPNLVNQLLKTVPIAIIVANKCGELILTNLESEKLFGYGRNEMIGKPVETLLPGYSRILNHRFPIDYQANQIMGPVTTEVELIAQHRSGSEFPVNIGLSTLKTDADIFTCCLIRDNTAHKREQDRIRDLNKHLERRIHVKTAELKSTIQLLERESLEHKRTEQALREAKDQAERINAIKSRFLAAASHDLRQPLQTMNLVKGILSLQIKDPELAETLDTLERSLSLMSGLLDALLDISKLDAGAVMPAKKDFEIGPLLQRLVKGLEPQAKNKGLELRIAPCRATVYSDALLLERIIHNFLSNAIRYTLRGKILVGCRHKDSRISIEVWDTGIGIAKDQLKSIFEEFYQLNNPARSLGKGRGLGLAIVERIARLLGHHLEVRSTLGKGSRFSVEVPLGSTSQRREDDSDYHRDMINALQQGVSIMLVEDDEAVLNATRWLLELNGFKVITAMTEQEAIAQINRMDPSSPDLLISDYHLPEGKKGIELIRKIRGATQRSIPAILLTGDITSTKMPTSQDIDWCMIAYKPIDADTLTAMIHAMLDAAESGSDPS